MVSISPLLLNLKIVLIVILSIHFQKPKPLDLNTYYIFAVDNNIGVDGLTYSRADMTANGGLGDIDLAEKNIQLFLYH